MNWIKKSFFLSLFIFCIALLFWGVYNISFKQSTSPEDAAGERRFSDLIPIIPKNQPNSKIAAITDEEIISPTLTEDKEAVKYYSKTNGKVFQIDFEGNSKKTLSEKELIGISDVLWSPDKSKVISKFINPQLIPKFYYYSYQENRGVALKENVDEIAWQSSSAKIFYKHFDPITKKRSLNFSDPDGTNWKKIADIEFRNIIIEPIPKSGLVSFWNKPDAYSATVLKSLPIVGGEEKIIFKDGYGADYLWNENSTKVLLSRSNERAGNKIQLLLMNENGGELKSLEIPTLVSKCVWSKDNRTIFYAMPGSIPSTAIMPNDYADEKFNSVDTFWKIDTATGEKTRLVELEEIAAKYDATKLFLSPDESILFFINRYDNKLYRIIL